MLRNDTTYVREIAPASLPSSPEPREHLVSWNCVDIRCLVLYVSMLGLLHPELIDLLFGQTVSSTVIPKGGRKTVELPFRYNFHASERIDLSK